MKLGSCLCLKIQRTTPHSFISLDVTTLFFEQTNDITPRNKYTKHY